MRTITLLISLVAALALAGCGDSVDNKPPAAALAPRTTAPPAKVPTTPQEKIAAIEKSSMPPAEKKKAIEQVQSGSL